MLRRSASSPTPFPGVCDTLPHTCRRPLDSPRVLRPPPRWCGSLAPPRRPRWCPPPSGRTSRPPRCGSAPTAPRPSPPGSARAPAANPRPNPPPPQEGGEERVGGGEGVRGWVPALFPPGDTGQPRRTNPPGTITAWPHPPVSLPPGPRPESSAPLPPSPPIGDGGPAGTERARVREAPPRVPRLRPRLRHGGRTTPPP